MFAKGSNLIISADDFGISQKANDNILKLVDTGKIDRLAVMIHGIIRQEDVARLLASGILLDLHADIRNNIDPKRNLYDGIFKRLVIFLTNYFAGENRPSHVEQRWDEQIQEFHRIFHKYPDGLNSHEHVHFFPPYFRVFLRLAKKYGISRIRFGKESPYGGTVVSIIIYLLRKFNIRTFNDSGRTSSDMMFSFDWIKKDVQKLLRYKPTKKIEVIFHPERDEEMRFLDTLHRR